MAKWLLAGLLWLVAVIQSCAGSGKVEIQMRRYRSSCSDNLGFTDCDTYFYLCIDKPGNWDFSSCFYRLYGPSTTYKDTNNMDFTNDVGGITLPLVTTKDRFETNRLMFVVKTMDKETFQSDEHLVTVGKIFTFTPAQDQANAPWVSTSMSSGQYHVWFDYRAYCDAHYFTSECDVYCKARDDGQGHYTCDPSTGQKRCITGWQGYNCDIDINECESGRCYGHAVCVNLPGSYRCICPDGLAGQNCDLISSLCHSSPCQHNGTCTGSVEYYHCSCPVEWTGHNCEVQVDFCQSNPCFNGATCYQTVGNYTCACATGWTDSHCTVEVDACESSPCRNGGTCTKRPRAEYECSCDPKFAGKNCEVLKNPCDPNPCQNSGTCNELTYDTYNCSCVVGYGGSNCESYINTDAERQTQTGENKTVDWLPIVIAVIGAFVLIVLILALIFFIRRRRQKKNLDVMEAQETGQEKKAMDRTNLAFLNGIYDKANRENSANERQKMPLPLPALYGSKQKAFEEDDGYMKPAKGSDVTNETRQKQAILDTRSLAAAGEVTGGVNPYADFEELKRNSMAARMSTDSLHELEETEENHYHQLDDVCLDAQNEVQNQASHYDVPQLSIRADIGNEQAVAEGIITDRVILENETSSDEDENDQASQEDIEQLRHQVLQKSAKQSVA